MPTKVTSTATATATPSPSPPSTILLITPPLMNGGNGRRDGLRWTDNNDKLTETVEEEMDLGIQ